MSVAWVVDSNCFIHLGQKAEDGFVQDLTVALNGGRLLITPGVEREVATVAFRRCNGRPRVLTALQPLLHSVPVDEADVRALAQKIGEAAAPQDVDLSLMVLADGLGADHAEVVLVSDDFKMTTTAERAHLRFTTCPPSTFVERLVEGTNDKPREARFRSLSRQVRAAEMSYAISRRDEYDVQKKLTWMVDSLLSSSHALSTDDDGPDDGQEERRKIADLTRLIRGYTIKPKRVEALGELPSICAPVSRLDAHLETLRTQADEHLPAAVESTSLLLMEVMEEVGMGLAPLDEEQAEIAHRAMAGSFLRTESALGLMARMAGHHQHARRHLARALHLATLVDDVGSERKAMRRLGMLALQAGNLERAARLFATAAHQPTAQPMESVPSQVLASITAALNGEQSMATEWVEKAAPTLMDAPGPGCDALEKVGRDLMAIERPDLAIELFDEAMECAVLAADETRLERLAERMVTAQRALDAGEHDDLPLLRLVLDRLTPVDETVRKAHHLAEAEQHLDE